MLKRIQESFSLKIFFITWAVLIFSNLLVLVGVYAFMPQIYTISYNESIHACMEEMEENLPRIRREESGDFFNELCEKYQIKLDIYDTYTYKRPEIPGIDKNYLCQIPESYSSAQEGAMVSQYSFGPDNARAIAMNGEKIEYSILSLSFSDCGPYDFALIPPRENKVNIFLSDLKRILPYLTSVIFLLAFAMGAIYTRYITGPVLRISRAAKAMSRMDWKNSRLFFRRKDEIGSLARSIDSTSHTLEQVLSQRDEANEMLRRELEKQKRLDQEQQEFFAAASHELKTPVTVLKGQLTGMLYQVGAYQDRDLYLKKSLKTVEEMESRILKILEVSRMERADRKAEIRKLELSKILRESYEPYEDLIEDKELRLQVSLPDSFKVLGDPKLLKSALENIRNALETLGEKLPVSVKITNDNGSEDIGLEIRAAQFDAFAESGIRDLVYTAQAGGNREEKAEAGPVLECDTTIKAANSLAAFAGLEEEDFSFAKDFDISYLAGREPCCTVDEQYGKLYGIEPGDSLELSLCQIKYKSDDGSFQFLSLGRASLKVIGTYRNSGQLSEVLLSADWLRRYTQEQGKEFYYDSARGVLADSGNLNRFKKKMENSAFGEVNPEGTGGKRGSCLMVQDQVFIETAGRLQDNLRLYERFQGPFFLLVYGISALLPFLLLRYRRKEAAVALSLGRSRRLTGGALFTENLLLELTGCMVSLPLLLVRTEISPMETARIMGIYAACLCLGTVTALAGILKFDVMKLLTKID